MATMGALGKEFFKLHGCFLSQYEMYYTSMTHTVKTPVKSEIKKTV